MPHRTRGRERCRWCRVVFARRDGRRSVDCGRQQRWADAARWTARRDPRRRDHTGLQINRTGATARRTPLSERSVAPTAATVACSTTSVWQRPHRGHACGVPSIASSSGSARCPNLRATPTRQRAFSGASDKRRSRTLSGASANARPGTLASALPSASSKRRTRRPSAPNEAREITRSGRAGSLRDFGHPERSITPHVRAIVDLSPVRSRARCPVDRARTNSAFGMAIAPTSRSSVFARWPPRGPAPSPPRRTERRSSSFCSRSPDTTAEIHKLRRVPNRVVIVKLEGGVAPEEAKVIATVDAQRLGWGGLFVGDGGGQRWPPPRRAWRPARWRPNGCGGGGRWCRCPYCPPVLSVGSPTQAGDHRRGIRYRHPDRLAVAGLDRAPASVSPVEPSVSSVERPGAAEGQRAWRSRRARTRQVAGRQPGTERLPARRY